MAHEKITYLGTSWCVDCRQPWPCDMARSYQRQAEIGERVRALEDRVQALEQRGALGTIIDSPVTPPPHSHVIEWESTVLDLCCMCTVCPTKMRCHCAKPLCNGCDAISRAKYEAVLKASR